VEIASAVFPIGHTCARLQRVVRLADCDKGLFDDRGALREFASQITVSPLFTELGASWLSSVAESGDLVLGPFYATNTGARGGSPGSGLRAFADQGVAHGVGVGPTFYE